MPPALSSPMMRVCGCVVLPFLLPFLWRLSVEKSPFDIHAQLAHFFEAFGSDEVLAVTVRFIFFDPFELLGGLDKHIPHGEWVDRPQTVLFFILGFHLAPLIDSGKMPTQFRMRLGRVGGLLTPGNRRTITQPEK